MDGSLEPIVLAIATLTFIILGFLPVLFMQHWGGHKRTNVWVCAVLVLVLIPSILYRWQTGQVIWLIGWGGCWAFAFLAKYKPVEQYIENRRSYQEPDTQVIELASALDKIQILERLAKQRANGSLSLEEFNEEKKRRFG